MNSELTILGIALGLGLLVGLQRERGPERIAGIRTFGLITVYGALCGILTNHFTAPGIVIVGLSSIALLMLVANLLQQKDENPDIGQTTEIAALLMFGVGCYLALGDMVTGIVIGAVVAILLYLKEFLKRHIAQLSNKDFQALMVFVAVTLVVFPILPDLQFGPYKVLNLREIWLMVVLIVGISVAGYFAYKWLGKKVGTGLNGILGGLISSTATTVTYSRLSRESGSSLQLSAFVIVAASAVSILRVMIEITIVSPGFVHIVLPPILIVAVSMALIALILFLVNSRDKSETLKDPQNPAQFKTALIFAFLYAVILVLIAFAKDFLGSTGLFAVSVMSGLTDMDAITLSLSNTMNNGDILPAEGWKYILVAVLANLVFKGGMVFFLGNRGLSKIVLPIFISIIIIGIITLIMW